MRISERKRLAKGVAPALALAVVFGALWALYAQESDDRGEAELRTLAQNAASQGKRSVVYKRSSRPATPVSTANRIANATIAVVVATGESIARFYTPPPTLYTWYEFRVDRIIASRVPTGKCTDPPMIRRPNHMWIQMEGGERSVSGVTVQHEVGWPVRPAANRRYLILGERCAPDMVTLTFGPQDIYELLPDNRIVANQWASPYVSEINAMGSAEKVRQAVESLR
jgi:hypothetical protein